MPTGYTEILQREPHLPFAEFAKRCARAMGACILQRDDSMDEPPQMDEPSRYHVERLEEAHARKAWLDEATDAELMVEQEKKLADDRRYASVSIEKSNATQASYERMLALVEAWEPPTAEHRGFKKFMVDQIRESIGFDCSSDYWRDKADVKPVPVAEYRADQLAMVARDIAYHTEENQKEIDRTNERNEWKRQLLESLNATVSSEL